eukprot:GFUD01041242.1.p1 GENE.GFUD01041242.1~~GFUD01041242.1.p1  ORF type:complete len:754 (+),score=153.48 GFUD01041242.1:270-2264(+)
MFSNDMESLKDVLEAAKTLDIDSECWTVTIDETERIDFVVENISDELVTQFEEVEKEVVPSPVTKNRAIATELEWSDCEITNQVGELGTQANETKIEMEIETEVSEINNNSGILHKCQVLKRRPYTRTRIVKEGLNIEPPFIITYEAVTDALEALNNKVHAGLRNKQNVTGKKRGRGRPIKRKNINVAGMERGRPKKRKNTEENGIKIDSETATDFNEVKNSDGCYLYTCKVCGKVFKRQVTMALHMSSEHLVILPKPVSDREGFPNDTDSLESKVIPGSPKVQHEGFTKIVFKTYEETLDNISSEVVSNVLEMKPADLKVQLGVSKKKRGRPKKNTSIFPSEVLSDALEINHEVYTGLKTKQKATKNTWGGVRVKKKNTDPLFCSECPKSFLIPSELNSHYASVHTKGSFECEKCRKKFKSRVGLEFHVISYHEEPNKVNHCCGVCGVIFLASGKTDLESKASAEIKLKNHMQVCHAEKKDNLQCFLCKEKFNLKQQLSKHILEAHTKTAEEVKIKPFNCSHPGCEKKYAHVQARCLHEKTHDPDAYQFSCQFCDKKFIHKPTFLLHLEIHDPWRKCKDCAKTLKSKSDFIRHSQRCRNEYRFPCPMCDKKFHVKRKLINHLRIHTGETPFSCDQCDTKFARKDDIREHMKRKDHLERNKRVS